MKTKWSSIIIVAFFVLAASGSFTYAAEAGNATSTPSQSVTFHIRHQDELVFEGSWELGPAETVLIEDTIGVERMATSTSVLAILLEIDKVQDSFRVSDLAYFSSFDAFLISCIEISARSLDACFNWQYVVNGTFPFISTDKYVLQGGEDVYLFFGMPHQVVLDKNEVEAGESFTAEAQNYQYQINEWEPLVAVTIGVTKENPDNPFLPIVIDSSLVNEFGKAVFTLETSGDYNVGIAEDFYFPSVALVILPNPATSTPSESSSGQRSGGGGGGGTSSSQSSNTIDVEKAIQFLLSNQKEDGSLGAASLYTDWAAVAFGAYQGTLEGKEAITNYLRADLNPGTLLTDYERRAIALMALGINPYDGTSTNYIQKILDQFDGTQFGDPDLVNDDIFALFPLLNAGFNLDDSEVAKTVSFILSHQKPDGSWIGVDLTAAAIQALALAPSIQGVNDVLAKAKNYLKGKQESSGGFDGNVFSTAWAMQAIKALGENETEWEKNGKTPGDYLALNQSQDGGMVSGDSNTRIWATAYAIPASLAKTWDEVLENVDKSAVSTIPSGGGGFSFSQPIHATTTQERIEQEPEEVIAPLSEFPLISAAKAVELPPSPLPETQIVSQDEGRDSIERQEELPFEEAVNIESPEEPFLAYAGVSSIEQIARTIFPVGVAISLILGLYLAWRFVRP